MKGVQELVIGVCLEVKKWKWSTSSGHSAHLPCWDKDNTCLLSNKGIYINIRMEEERRSGDIIRVCLYRCGRRKKEQELSCGLPLKGGGKDKGQLEWAFLVY